MTHLKKGPRETFERAGLVNLLDDGAFCKDVASAMVRIEQSMRER